jgi:hypothetical protein
MPGSVMLVANTSRLHSSGELLTDKRTWTKVGVGLQLEVDNDQDDVIVTYIVPVFFFVQ